MYPINNKNRESNFELLRIFCMLGVLLNHILSLYDLHTLNYTIANELRMLLQNLVIISVNCFILISGYFKIKIKWKGFLNLYLQCSFYGFLFYCIAWIFYDGSIIDVLKHSLFSLTGGGEGFWFFPAYVGLYLISPLLNSGYKNLSNWKRVIVLFLLIIIDLYLGYWRQCQEITINGYHMIHFIVLYYIGNMIFDYKLYLPKLKNRQYIIIIGVILILMNVLHDIKMFFPPIAIIYSLRYNSPVVLLFSVFFFIWVTNWKLNSKFINWIASSVLSVYIIHYSPVAGTLFWNVIKYNQVNYSPIVSVIMMIITIMIFYSLCILLDKIRIILCRPLMNFLTKKLETLTIRLKSIIDTKINN